MTAPLKHPNRNEKIDIYEQLLHDLHYHRTVTNDQSKVNKLLIAIGKWSEMHVKPNGGVDEKAWGLAIDEAFWALNNR